MHWRKPFPPKQFSVLDDLIAVWRGAFRPERVMAPLPELPDELPPAELSAAAPPAATGQ
jgi:hypothetical protein